MSALRFAKYEGLGNDFLIVDASERVTPDEAVALCDRHLGVGGDGVLLVDASAPSMRVLNADGSVAEMCGNGLRCVVLHLARQGVLPDGGASFTTGAGPHHGRLVTREGDAAEVEVAMAVPTLEPASIPTAQRLHETVLHGLRFTGVGMGNPHAVTFDAIDDAERLALGPRVQSDPMFPAGVNVGFARIEDHGIVLHVLERGAGWTRACGTGACACVVAAVETGRVARGVPTTVHLPGGPLTITVGAPGEPVRMRGPARHVFDGVVAR